MRILRRAGYRRRTPHKKSAASITSAGWSCAADGRPETDCRTAPAPETITCMSLAALHRRNLLKEIDLTPDEFRALLDLAAELKAAKREGREERRLTGKNVALIFEKTSTRTRCAFEVAAA